MRTIKIERTDGGVSIMRLYGPEAPIDEITKWETTSGMKMTRWCEIDNGEVPIDRSDRNDWKF